MTADGLIGPTPLTMSQLHDDLESEFADLYGSKARLISATTGTNTVTGSTTPALSAIADGMSFWFVPVATNTGAMTLSIDGLAAANIVRADGSSMDAGNIVISLPYKLFYFAGKFWVVSSNVGIGQPAFKLVQDITLTPGNTSIEVLDLGSFETLRIRLDVFLQTANGEIGLTIGNAGGYSTGNYLNFMEGLRVSTGNGRNNENNSTVTGSIFRPFGFNSFGANITTGGSSKIEIGRMNIGRYKSMLSEYVVFQSANNQYEQGQSNGFLVDSDIMDRITINTSAGTFLDGRLIVEAA